MHSGQTDHKGFDLNAVNRLIWMVHTVLFRIGLPCAINLLRLGQYRLQAASSPMSTLGNPGDGPYRSEVVIPLESVDAGDVVVRDAVDASLGN